MPVYVVKYPTKTLIIILKGLITTLFGFLNPYHQGLTMHFKLYSLVPINSIPSRISCHSHHFPGGKSKNPWHFLLKTWRHQCLDSRHLLPPPWSDLKWQVAAGHDQDVLLSCSVLTEQCSCWQWSQHSCTWSHSTYDKLFLPLFQSIVLLITYPKHIAKQGDKKHDTFVDK